MKATKLGLIGAMNEEVVFFHEHMQEVVHTTHAGVEFYEGRFYNLHVVVCKSGVGKVNAAICTQVLIDQFLCDAIVFTGVAGALDPQLEIGDIVVSEECMQHDMDVTPLGYARGIIPYQATSVFTAHPELVRIAMEAGQRLSVSRIVSGRILSGDQFIANRETVMTLRQELNGTCAEMEGAAVAQVCVMNDIPFVVIRSMSDKADGSASVNFPEFAHQAAENSFRIVREMVQIL
ncbi:MAG: 5'-methylthioadenosine/adenosylhomocysteine nucleosidase [Gorillibacterium sp.]|nr:5'-methylthioadenosine/adenosylhomocysteine nucleosidase [Gorillibacterium sp.]